MATQFLTIPLSSGRTLALPALYAALVKPRHLWLASVGATGLSHASRKFLCEPDGSRVKGCAFPVGSLALNSIVEYGAKGSRMGADGTTKEYYNPRTYCVVRVNDGSVLVLEECASYADAQKLVSPPAVSTAAPVTATPVPAPVQTQPIPVATVSATLPTATASRSPYDLPRSALDTPPVIPAGYHVRKNGTVAKNPPGRPRKVASAPTVVAAAPTVDTGAILAELVAMQSRMASLMVALANAPSLPVKHATANTNAVAA
jgi:hypothetical protein